jgi:hypothetical protein
MEVDVEDYVKKFKVDLMEIMLAWSRVRQDIIRCT